MLSCHQSLTTNDEPYVTDIQFNLYLCGAVKTVRQQRRFGSMVYMELLSLKAVSNKNVFKHFRKIQRVNG